MIISKLESCREFLESKGFRVSSAKIEYIICNFDKTIRRNGGKFTWWLRNT